MATLLSVNNYYYPRGGAEIVFLEHNRLFEARGWQVVPFSMRHPQNLPSPWADYFVEDIEYGRDYAFHQQLPRVLKAIYSLEARRKLGALLRQAAPDLCHAHNIYHHISPSILGLLHARGVPTVLTLHDLKVVCPAYSMLAPDGVCERCRGGRLRNVVRHRCLKGSLALSSVAYVEARLHGWLGSYDRCVSRFVVPSRFYLEKLCEWGKPRESLRHVPNFVDLERHQPQYQPGTPFVYVGRLSREKGLATLVRAAAASGCAVRLVGTGPQKEELQRLAESLAAPVSFTGFLSGAALTEAVASARAVVLPSEWYENAPLSILEAYALGKPVIGARIGGIPELIREEATGLCFESGNAEALAAALRAFAARPSAGIAELGRTARSWVETDFSPDVYRERMLGVYRELGVQA